MAFKRKKQPSNRPKVSIPVYYTASDEDYQRLLDGPKEVPSTLKFYSSLRYPDSEVEIDLWINERKN